MGLWAATAAVRAETLEEALVTAYQSNPALQAQRAQLRAIDETYVQTAAELAPTVSLQSQFGYDRSALAKMTRDLDRLTTPNLPNYTEQNAVSTQLVVTQPIYTGGKAAADLKAANAQVRAAREALRTAEANVLFNVIAAYADVQRDQQALEVRRISLDMLVHQVEETKARLKAGEVTRTDVAQAEAQWASEQALYVAAQGQLANSRTNYLAVVGQGPQDLAPAPDLIGIPATLDEAVTAGERFNPDLQQAILSEMQSRAKVLSAKAALNPTVSAQIQSGYQGSVVPYDPRNLNRVLSVSTTLVVPLYSGSVLQSQVRQSIEQNSSDRLSIENAHRVVIQNLATSWSQRLVAQASVAAQARQVDAAKIAFEGMRKEYRTGERSTLDVLIAGETLWDAELSLISAKHDAYVYSAAVLQNMGWLEIRNLVASARTYRPADHLRQIESKLNTPWQDSLQKLDEKGAPALRPVIVAHEKPETPNVDDPVATKPQ